MTMLMLRKNRAKALAIVTTALIALAAGTSAQLRNPAPDADAAVSPSPARDDPRLDRGRQAFARLNCTACHAVAGQGNPSLPLDGIGARLSRSEIHDWTTGTGVAKARLPGGVVRMKSPAIEDPDLDPLLEYLVQLK
jgi:mono/diheme cytochrome c family protein